MTLLDVWDGEAVLALQRTWDVPLLEAYDSIGSTNDRAAELVTSGCDPYTIVVANEQTEGRGRQGATWSSARDAGLWMSVVLPPEASGRLSFIPLLLGLAIAEAIEESAPGLSVGMKWPNDVWIDGHKVAGVLCEASVGRVVAGVGVNLESPPGGFDEGLSGIATSLEAQGIKSLSRTVLAAAMLAAMRRWLTALSSTLSPKALAALRDRDVLEGQWVVTDQAGEGRAAGITPDGALILQRTGGVVERVVAGSVRLR